MQADPTQFVNPVSEQDSSTITVPSGEVWRGVVLWNGAERTREDGIEVNGIPVFNANTDTDSVARMGGHTDRLTLVGGDTISTSSSAYDGVAFQGYEVSSFMNNRPVSIQLSGSESATVPPGEVWEVCLSFSQTETSGFREPVSINGIICFGGSTDTDSSYNEGESTWVVLDSGDEVQCNDAIGVGIHGWVVSE